jgi:hypothetical protein
VARHSVLVILLAGALASACFSIAPAATQPTAVSPSPAPPSVTAEPTAPPEVTLPPATATPQPTQAPPATPAPTPTQEPDRTLAPGETPSPSPLDVSDFLTATVSVVNLTDEAVDVSVDIFSEGENQGTIANLDVEPYGSIFQSVPETTYAVTFTRGAADPVTCLMTLADGGELAFTLVGTDIMVFDPNVEITDPDDLFVETSALCAA